MKKMEIIPNLRNYDEMCKKFRWKNAEKEIAFFDSKHRLLNVAYHIEKICREKKDKAAIFWDSGRKRGKITFSSIARESSKFANFLKKIGIRKGDVCFIFLPRVPELYFAFLGILKIGAIPSILFPAFGSEGVEERIQRGNGKLLVTNSELAKRVYKIKNLKLPLRYIIVVGKKNQGREKRKWKEISFSEIRKEKEKFNIVKTKSSDAAFMVFTSSTAGTPVAGIVIPHYALVQQIVTAKWVLDLHAEDIYWCTADPSWVTGVVYGIIAPLSIGISQVVYEGKFDAEKWYGLIQHYNVNVLYTAPTAIRMLMQTSANRKYNLKSLRHICSVGEALNPEALRWVRKEINLPVYDTYWQTETGAIMISNFRCEKIKEGSMGKPVPGIKAFIINESGKILKEEKEGLIAFKPEWPAIMSSIYGNRKLYRSYFKHGLYITGDRAYKKDGYFFFVGRRSDMIKTAGERVSAFEVESCLLEHKAIAESAVIGKPDPLRGEIIVAFIVLKKDYKASGKLKEEIQKFVKNKLAGHAYPREIYFINELPKTRSGKIIRALLRSIVKKEKPTIPGTILNSKCVEEIEKIFK